MPFKVCYRQKILMNCGKLTMNISREYTILQYYTIILFIELLGNDKFLLLQLVIIEIVLKFEIISAATYTYNLLFTVKLYLSVEICVPDTQNRFLNTGIFNYRPVF